MCNLLIKHIIFGDSYQCYNRTNECVLLISLNCVGVIMANNVQQSTFIISRGCSFSAYFAAYPIITLFLRTWCNTRLMQNAFNNAVCELVFIQQCQIQRTRVCKSNSICGMTNLRTSFRICTPIMNDSLDAKQFVPLIATPSSVVRCGEFLFANSNATFQLTCF